jgi:hypothetical protein
MGAAAAQQQQQQRSSSRTNKPRTALREAGAHNNHTLEVKTLPDCGADWLLISAAAAVLTGGGQVCSNFRHTATIRMR